MAYQSLYRRYRPQKFAEIRGQEHVVKALRNAVRDDRVGHAYLLKGPRGTGKTTAARVLAKVLNCEAPADGEPCGECESCRSIEAGTSFDLHELDAASNNKVDDIRDLLSKVALGTPGRTKVYLLDEVHMLTAGAENALLKTLEEPPDHVVFILATTEPHKVVSTIRSRTQQLQLSLISADEMTSLVKEIAADAGLDVDDDAIGHVIKVGGGSARDTLSALDQVVAAGGVTYIDTSTSDLLNALAEKNPGLAVRAVEAATQQGVDPRQIGERFIDALRTIFLVKMGSPPARLSDPERKLADRFVEQLSPATITRSLETIGRSLVDMRQAPDPRIDLEVAFVRIANPSISSDPSALIARIEALEASLASGGAPPPSSTGEAPPTTIESTTKTEEKPTEPASVSEKAATPAAAARAALKPKNAETPESGAKKRASRPAPPPPSRRDEQPAGPVEAEAAADSAPGDISHSPAIAGGATTIEVLRAGWAAMLEGRSTPARARFLAGEPRSVDSGVITYVLPSDAQMKRCEPYKAEVEQAISATFNEPLTIRLDVGSVAMVNSDVSSSSSPSPDAGPTVDDDEIDIQDLTDADPGGNTVLDRITDAFPGAEVMAPPES